MADVDARTKGGEAILEALEKRTRIMQEDVLSVQVPCTLNPEP